MNDRPSNAVVFLNQQIAQARGLFKALLSAALITPNAFSDSNEGAIIRERIDSRVNGTEER